MFVRVRRRKTPTRTYAYLDIVHSRRVEGKVRHEILGTVGRWDELSPEILDALAERMQAMAARMRGTGRRSR